MTTLSRYINKLASFLPYDFNDPNKLEEALLLPGATDDQRRDGNRKVLAIGRQGLTLAIIMETEQYNSNIREDVRCGIDGVAARKRRAEAAKWLQLDRTLQRSPCQQGQTLSDKILERAIFALIGVVCIDSGADLGAMTKVYTFLMSPTAPSPESSVSPIQTAALPASRPDSRVSPLSVAASMSKTLEKYRARERQLCKENNSPPPDVLSSTDVKAIYIYFALGSQETIVHFAECMEEYQETGQETGQDYCSFHMDGHECLDHIRKLSSGSNFDQLCRRYLAYRYYNTLKPEQKKAFDNFVSCEQPKAAKEPGNPRNRGIGAARDSISQTVAFDRSDNSEKQEELKKLSDDTLKLGANLNMMVEVWGLGALAFLEGDKRDNRGSECHIKVTDKMIRDLGHDTFRPMVHEFNSKAGETFRGISKWIKPWLQLMLKGEPLELDINLSSLEPVLLNAPRFYSFANLEMFYNPAPTLDSPMTGIS